MTKERFYNVPSTKWVNFTGQLLTNIFVYVKKIYCYRKFVVLLRIGIWGKTLSIILIILQWRKCKNKKKRKCMYKCLSVFKLLTALTAKVPIFNSNLLDTRSDTLLQLHCKYGSKYRCRYTCILIILSCVQVMGQGLLCWDLKYCRSWVIVPDASYLQTPSEPMLVTSEPRCSTQILQSF